MRGKIESGESVIKRVSKNLILSKRKRPKYEFYLDPDQLNAYLQRKQNDLKNQKNIDGDFGLSKAYYLLPHFCRKDEDDILANDEVKKEESYFSARGKSGPSFVSPELTHLNSPPPYEYLQITDPFLKKKKLAPRLNFGSSLKKHNE